MKELLRIKNLKAITTDDGTVILNGVNLTINEGEIHAIMGPNGSGKSTLSNVIMGSPKYEVTEGDILFKGQSILDLSTDARAKLGIFLSFQTPEEVDGVKMRQFLLNAYRNIHSEDTITALKLNKLINEFTDTVHLDKEFLNRYVNTGFSGGERKKSEIMQMGLLKPKMAILDEIDSGLDVDALRKVAESINKFKCENMGILMITHYQRVLDYVKPDFVHVYNKGKIATTGNADLALKVEENGYANI
jgi:Fe-S cluster assembly ATP-binding protein